MCLADPLNHLKSYATTTTMQWHSWTSLSEARPRPEGYATYLTLRHTALRVYIEGHIRTPRSWEQGTGLTPCQQHEGSASTSSTTPPSYYKNVARQSISKKTSTRMLTDGPAAAKIQLKASHMLQPLSTMQLTDKRSHSACAPSAKACLAADCSQAR